MRVGRDLIEHNTAYSPIIQEVTARNNHIGICQLVQNFHREKRVVYICREFVRMERIVSKKAYICNAEVRTQNTKSR